MSMYPRVIFNVDAIIRAPRPRGRRHTVSNSISNREDIWPTSTSDAEFGPRASTVGRSEWLYGIVCGFDVAKQTMLMAELHDVAE